MGRPTNVKPVRTGTSRREFFKRSAGGAALVVAATPLAPLGSASASTAERAGAAVFQHGVASGDPLQDRVILWTRVTPRPESAPDASDNREEDREAHDVRHDGDQDDDRRNGKVMVHFVVALDPQFKRLVTRGHVKTGAERDHTVKVDVSGLRPDTTYYYQFSALGASSAIGRTKTLPRGEAQHLRMAVVSCSNFAYGHFNAYRQIAQRADLDMVVHLGDYIYEYGNGQYGDVRPCEPAHEIVTLADYRQRHAQYKADADSQAMHRQHPLIAIWDDHETANNAWKDGAENHQNATEGAWPERVQAALQAYYEWMPVRVTNPANLRRNNRAFAFGNLVDLIMLEERLGGRSQQLEGSIPTPLGMGFMQTGAFADPSRQLLGSDEEAWLFDKLRTSTAKWKVLGQGVMFAQLKLKGAPNALGGGVFFNSDQWDGYQPARNRVYDVIKGANGGKPVNNVVVLTGDIHSAWAADLTQDPNNPEPSLGGYNPLTGEGSLAVEFVGTSVTSPGVSDPTGAVANSLKPANPHFKHIDLDKRGYMLIDATPQRCVCEFWQLDTVAAISNVQMLGAVVEVRDGLNRLQPSAITSPKANPAKLAP
ncbi:MAG: alkaline phosphatase D family protein [Proteobacteria bacterium]|uniref:alkaline phosphatase D family protein n=1 Tax=Aquabacterium sp. TaxID=1872578 RepID=UPI0035C6685B|nr:alkaline phosphatase D family protein [Pseudomonadota bacterium]